MCEDDDEDGGDGGDDCEDGEGEDADDEDEPDLSGFVVDDDHVSYSSGAESFSPLKKAKRSSSGDAFAKATTKLRNLRKKIASRSPAASQSPRKVPVVEEKRKKKAFVLESSDSHTPAKKGAVTTRKKEAPAPPPPKPSTKPKKSAEINLLSGSSSSSSSSSDLELELELDDD